MGRKRKTRWRRLSIGEISANEDEDGEIGVAVISLTRSHSASQNHSPARSDKPLSGVITMTNNNTDSSSSSPSLHNSSTNLSTPAGSGGNNGGGPTGSTSSPANSKILSSDPSMTQTNSEKPPQNSLTPSSSSSPNPNSQSNSGYHNSHNHVPSSYHNSSHHPPHSVSSNESGCGSTSSSTGGGGGGSGTGHYNDRYHYTRENYRPPHHHHHHHNQHHSSHHNSNYNGSSSAPYQGGGESGGGGGSGSSRGERGSSYHYSGNPHGHKEYQNGYHGSGHYSGYQGGSTYYRNSHNNYRNAHYNSGGSSGGTGGGEPYNGGESEGYHYPPSSRPYGGRFRKSRSYTASSYYYTNGSSKTSGGASNNTTDNINRPSYNQDEYTKITTPRQDVLFKKGYLSQKKTQPSSSVDSASAATTPSASTNGTPDTQSTNGINSDNSEGYDNDNQTDYVIPSTYDDTIYYAPPPEAMFTDPNTGQVYYGHCSTSGEYYDAYPVSPVMVATGYPPVYYPMVPYTPIDWNGVPAPMYPMVAAPAPPAPLVPTEDSSLISPGLQLTDEASTTTANTETCANLSDTTITTTENSKGADDLTIKEQLREESSELSTTQKNCDKNKSWETSPREIGEDGESYGEKSSTQAVTSEEKTTPSTTTTKVETTMVTGSETGQVKKQSCDSKLGNNIISSKEFTPVKPATTTAEGADSVGKVNALPLLSPSPLSFSSVDGVRTATASLTLESLDKMNKEIEIRPLKQEMSGAELTEKVDSQRIDFTTTTTSGVLTPPQPLPARTTSKSTQDEGEESASPAKVTQGDLKAAETLFTSSFLPSTSTSSSSCPSSANESSTSSPINGSTSLMRFQPKSATSKNLANEDDDKSITNHMEKSEQESCSSGGKPSNSNNNSKKKQKRNHTPSLSNGNQESHKSSKIGVDVKDEVNLLKKHQKGNSKGYQEKAGDNGEENNKSVSSDDTNENGEASQNHTASTQESGQSEQESCSQETAAAQSPQANVGEGDTPTVTPSLPKSSSSGLSRKPVDLTVQCPAANGNDDGHYETLQLQRSPSLANEPSSPDSLNTNQSVAGSEFAPGENLSVSESDLLNRTTSIDEVEEDLPQEVEYAVGGDEGAAEVRWSSTATADEDESTKQSCEITSSSSANQITAIKLPESENGTNAFTPSHEEFATTATKTTEGDLVNVGHNVRDGPCSSGGWESGEKSNDVTTEEVAAAVEEPIKSARTTTGAATTPTSQSSCNSGVQESGVEGEEGREAPLRPQSITLAVTEWLKTQGEDALTPIIARASSSDEFEGDVEETSDDEDYDENDDIDEENRVQSRGGDENASNLDQNQKNASGQPCLVAPSNKSGSSTSNKVTSRRRSGTKKSESKAKNDGSRFSGLPLKDGVCRVAPQFSSASAFNTTTTKTLNGAKALLEHNCKTSNRNINNSIKTKNSNALVSISSTCTSDDQDESYATDSNNKRKHSKQQNYNFKNSKTPVKVPSPPPITDSDKVGGEISGSTDISSMKNKIEDETAFYELGKDYDSGLELSSPENSSSSSVSRNFSSNALTLNANNKAKDSVNASTSWTTTSSPSTVSLPTSSACFDASICGSSSLRESSKRNKRPTLPKLAIDNITNKSLYSKYISPNSDHIVIAAPLSIIPLDSSADAPGAGESRRKNEKEQEISELSSSSVSLSQNNCMSTSPSLPSSPLNNTDVAGIVVQSPGSVPSTSTSMDERDHAEICDPQKYAKYYQFGVVFDTSDDPDQGIDTAAEEEEDGRESDSLDDVTLDSPPLPPPPNSLPNKNASVLSSEAVTSATDKDNGNSCEQKQGPHHCHRPQQKNPNDFLAFMQQRNRNLARKIKKSGDEKHNRDDVLVSKSIYHQEEDEEIGTFDPKAILERRLRRGSSNTVDTGDIALGEAASDEGSRYDADMDSVNNAPAASAIVCSLSEPPPLSMSHLYVNPLSLAAEMSGSENLNVGNDSQERKKKIAINEDDSSSFDSSSSDEPPLPPYESPPSIEIPVYNANTPSARVIRQNLYPIGDPVSGAICCSIQ